MKQEKALELVERYSRLTRGVADCGRRIGGHLDLCRGINGDRLAVDENGWPTHYPELDAKNRDKGLHLWAWYQPEIIDDGTMSPTRVWEHVGADIHGAECPHCYAAHLAIQERKQLRKQLGAVKGAMTKAVKK